MLQGDNISTKNVHELSENEMQRIRDFFQGAVYCWCKNRKGEWFSARDFIGGDNYYWEHYPLGILYLRQIGAGKTHEEAHEQAAKDAGHILKKVLFDDDRIFETKDGYTRSYLWIEE